MIKWIIAALAVWILQGTLIPSIAPYYYSILLYTGINIVLAVSLNLINGFTGQFSMGHAGFMAVGGYFAAWMTTLLRAWDPVLWSSNPLFQMGVFLLAILGGGLLAAIVGVMVGLPSLRLKGDYLAIVTLGFGEIIRVVLLNLDFLGGARGLPDIPLLANFGIIYSFVVLVIFVIYRLTRSSYGRACLAVREDEIAAESVGVRTTRAKVLAFVVGSFFAGIAGALYGHVLQYLNPATFDFNRSFDAIIMVVLGGMGSITGSVVAAIFLTVTKEALRPLQEITQVDFRMVIYSLVLIVMMLTRPNGIFGRKEWYDLLPKKREKDEAAFRKKVMSL